MPLNTKAGCTANVDNQIIPLNDSSVPDVMEPLLWFVNEAFGVCHHEL